MTIQVCSFEAYYPAQWQDPALSEINSIVITTPLSIAAKSFMPSAGLMYIHRPSARRRALNSIIDRLEDCELLVNDNYIYSLATITLPHTLTAKIINNSAMFLD